MRTRRAGLAVTTAAVAAAAALFAAAELAYRALRDRGCRRSGEGAFALYIVGESTARGAPYEPAVTLAGLVAGRFGGRLGGRKIQPIVLAETGESIYPQSVALERALRCRDEGSPGAVLIYSGHNDAGNAHAMSFFERLTERVFDRSALLSDLIFFLEKNGFIGRERTLDAWRYHLRRVVALSRRAGLVPVLATAASNLSGVDPALPSDPASAALSKPALARGRELEAKGRFREALAYYEEQAALHPPLRTYLTYRMGRCLEALGRYEPARRAYQEALDGDSPVNFGRATSAQNDFIRRLAAEESVPLVDAVALFARRSPHGILGDALFIDGHHPNLAGYLLLADAYSARLGEAFHESPRSSAGEDDAVRRFRASGKEQARALVRGGAWFFSVAALHGNPEIRLNQARDRYRRAAALAPDDFSAWLGLGLTQAALKTGLLSSPEGLDWVGRRGLFYFAGETGAVSEDDVNEIAAWLRAAGAEEGVVASMLRAHRVPAAP